MAKQLPFSCLCKAVVEKKKNSMERERTCTQNGEDRIVKIQELVYNRPSLIRSQVGSVSTFGHTLQFRIFLILFFSNLCVYSVQCRQKVKLNNANVHSSIVMHKREKESAIIMCVFSLVLAYVSVYICMRIYMDVLVCVCQGVQICVTVSMCRWGVGVSCVLVCRRPWMLSRLQLGTAMVHVQFSNQQEQASYKLNSHTLKTSTFPMASSSMSSRAMKQAINTCIVLGCQSEQEVQGIFRFIWILTFFRWIVYIYIGLIPVWSSYFLHSIQVSPLPPPPNPHPPPPTCTQRATTATKYSMHVLPLLPPHPQEGIWSKVSTHTPKKKMNISRTYNTEQQESQQTTLWRCNLGACYQWLSWAISLFCNMSLPRVWRWSWSPVRSLCRSWPYSL